jgi:hypothetical protein
MVEKSEVVCGVEGSGVNVALTLSVQLGDSGSNRRIWGARGATASASASASASANCYPTIWSKPQTREAVILPSHACESSLPLQQHAIVASDACHHILPIMSIIQLEESVALSIITEEQQSNALTAIDLYPINCGRATSMKSPTA